ncbi:RNA polymerase III-inhibiting protein maf1, partial [Nowakowskiella sp. JEL0407]
MKYLEYPILEQLNQAFSCVDAGDCRVFGRIEAYSCKDAGQDRKLRQYIDSKYLPTNEDTFGKSIDSNSSARQRRRSGMSPPTIQPPISSPPTTTMSGSRYSNSHGGASGYLGSSFGLSTSFAGKSFESDEYESRIAVSPFGPLSESTSRKTLFYLLATLNAAFPDYDFSDVKPEFFCKIPTFSIIINTINTTLFNLGNEKFSQIAGSNIWDAIEEVMSADQNGNKSGLVDVEIYQFLPDESSEPGAEEGSLAVSFIAPIQPEENMDLIQDMDLGMDYEMREEDNDMSYEQYTMFEQE